MLHSAIPSAQLSVLHSILAGDALKISWLEDYFLNSSSVNYFTISKFN